MSALFPIVQIIYWLSLSTWFGGVLFIAVAAPIIFRTIRESDPTLPMVLSVNLEGQHSTLLAGSIVANLLKVLLRVEFACAAGLLVGLFGQWCLADREGPEFISLVLRSALYLAALGVVIYDRAIVSPQIERYRQRYIDHADEPEIANPAKEQFDRVHKESVTLLGIMMCLLLAVILFSSTIRQVSMTFHSVR